MSEPRRHEAELWAFSLDRYARPGVGDMCIELQDTLGADVNVALICLWSAQRGVALSADQLSQIIAAGAGAWHTEVVRPLRAARRAAKPAASADSNLELWRDKLKAVEIEAERHEQRLLAEAFDRCVGEEPSHANAAKPIAKRNLTAYLQLIAPHQPLDFEAKLDQLIDTCID